MAPGGLSVGEGQRWCRWDVLVLPSRGRRRLRRSCRCRGSGRPKSKIMELMASLAAKVRFEWHSTWGIPCCPCPWWTLLGASRCGNRSRAKRCRQTSALGDSAAPTGVLKEKRVPLCRRTSDTASGGGTQPASVGMGSRIHRCDGGLIWSMAVYFVLLTASGARGL